MSLTLFPFAQYWQYYAAFTVLVLVLLAVDLGVFHRRAHAIRFREAALWCAVWFTLAMLFAGIVYSFAHWRLSADPRFAALPGWNPGKMAAQTTLEYLTGYVVEWSLSVDNLFVFVLIFRYFAVPNHLQHRVLFFGILGALIFRGAFIGAGVALIRFQWVVMLLGLFLVFTGIRLPFSGDEQVEPEKNRVIRLFRRWVPVTAELHGARFWVKVNGVPCATPLMIVLLSLEMTDILFAVDSVPAIFAVTREPLVIFTSNIFAILGLRAAYFLLAGAVDKFYLLKYGISIVLVFIGLKMLWLNRLYGGQFPTSVSLAVIVTAILTSIGLSLFFPQKQPAD
jgi:tellurite resistance protein TerC